MNRFLASVIGFAALSLTAMSLHAQDLVFKSKSDHATLVELFSSEGCSSCPPAEAWVSNLKTSPGLWTEIFPVAFHVDYWDGLGWPDRFAKSVYTERQRNYAAQLGQDSVYTPEFVVSGHEWRGWFHGDRSPSAETRTSGELTLLAVNGGTKVSATYTPNASSITQVYTLNVALLGVNIVSDVRSGENGGRQLTHDFVVLDFASKPMTDGPRFQSGPIDLKPSTNDSPGAIVAWVSAPNGEIVQMTGGWLKAGTNQVSLR